MLAGLPQLLIPRHQEQLLLARRLVAQGSALLAYQDQPGYAKEINALLTNPDLRTSAATLGHTCRQRGDPDAKGYIRAALTSLLVEVSPYNVGTVIT
jgi:UDP:flavonoid glycosyltransferase YjiC (YdhE family)